MKGNAAHAALDYNFTEKLENGEDANVGDVLDAYLQKFDELASDADFEGDDPDQHKDSGARAVEFHIQKVAPHIIPVEVETWLDVEFENVPYRLHQRGDVIDVEGRIIDHKFSGKKIDPSTVEVDFQLSSYAFAYRQKYQEDPTAVRLDRIVTTKTKGNEYQPITAHRGQRDYDRMLNTLHRVATSIMEWRYYPCDDTMKCGWCGYKPICWHKPWWEYVKAPEMAQDEARKLMARKLAVGTIVKTTTEDGEDG